MIQTRVIEERRDDLYLHATILSKVVVGLLKQRLWFDYTIVPKYKRDDIRVWNRRMRIHAIEKFYMPTFISSVNYYKTTEDMEHNRAVGVLVLFVPEDYITRLLKIFHYPPVDPEDDSALKDACGAICNIIAGKYKLELSSMGFIELEMSYFSNYLNTAMRGIDFCEAQTEKYEVTFYIDRFKRFSIELSMGTIPRVY